MNLRNILTNPLGFPILSQTVFPGDHVLLVPDSEYAGESEILAEIATILLENGLNTEDIQILLTDSEEVTVSSRLQKRLPKGVRIPVHRPARREQLALLGVNKADEPIALCRDLIDADLVISVGRFYTKPPKDHFGLHTAIFPRFSDAATQHRFAEAKGGAKHRQLQAEVDEAAQLLGIIFTIQFLQERGKSLQIAAGLPELVAETLLTAGHDTAKLLNQ
ncbi:MAG: lactate racemase domain-containing protein [Planctomycetaceae bacterium]|jgi:nickel-dependent lactate racemase|nr:lactate racemase domain-containing protein [Planctomycetaceae bacterium]